MKGKYVPLFEDFFDFKKSSNEEVEPDTQVQQVKQNNPIKSRGRKVVNSTKELQDEIAMAIREDGPNVDLNYIDVSNITDMRLLFSDLFLLAKSHEEKQLFRTFNGDISQWNTSKVTDMSYMFCHCWNFNGDISKWDVSNVTNMSAMFAEAYKFNSDISKWNTSNVRYMDSMFYAAEEFNQPIGNWDVSNVRTMNHMFGNAYNFNQPIENWNTNRVEDFGFMFWKAKSFNQDISKWQDSEFNKTVNIEDIFYSCPIKDNFKPEFLKNNKEGVNESRSYRKYVPSINEFIAESF